MTMTEARTELRVPRFRRGIRLRFDKPRGQWVLLAPERAFVPDAITAEILRMVDGERSVGVIAQTLAERFCAPLDVVTQDIARVLEELAGRGAIEL